MDTTQDEAIKRTVSMISWPHPGLRSVMAAIQLAENENCIWECMATPGRKSMETGEWAANRDGTTRPVVSMRGDNGVFQWMY